MGNSKFMKETLQRHRRAAELPVHHLLLRGLGLGHVLDDPPEPAPGDHVPDHAGQHQDVGVLGVNLEDDRAVAAETLERKAMTMLNNRNIFDFQHFISSSILHLPCPSLPPGRGSSCGWSPSSVSTSRTWTGGHHDSDTMTVTPPIRASNQGSRRS